MKKTFIILLSFLMFSCVSTRKVMNSWVGSTKQQLIKVWGPPSKTASDGATGEILVYSRKVYISGSQYVTAQTYWDNKYFYVNSSGKVYHWIVKSEQVPPQQIDLNVYKRY